MHSLWACVLAMIVHGTRGEARLVCDPVPTSDVSAAYIVTAVSFEAKAPVLARLAARFPEIRVKDFGSLPMFAPSALTHAHVQFLLRDSGVAEVECDSEVQGSLGGGAQQQELRVRR